MLGVYQFCEYYEFFHNNDNIYKITSNMTRMKHYYVKESKNRLTYTSAIETKDSLLSDVQKEILLLLSKKPLYPIEIAKRLNLHEQKVYYQVKKLYQAGLLEIHEKQEIRGTIAKRYKTKALTVFTSLGGSFGDAHQLFSREIDPKLEQFLTPFIVDFEFQSHFIVGSPDPHGPHKARARDGHHAIDLSLFIGKYCYMPDSFSVKLDVDVKAEKMEADNLIIIGGPVTNLLTSHFNKHLPVRFTDTKPFSLVVGKKRYIEESTGFICKLKNPYNPSKSILVLAGISVIGTKAAILALTREYERVLDTYANQPSWACVVQGFDLDGDGKIDSIEILE